MISIFNFRCFLYFVRLPSKSHSPSLSKLIFILLWFPLWLYHNKREPILGAVFRRDSRRQRQERRLQRRNCTYRIADLSSEITIALVNFLATFGMFDFLSQFGIQIAVQ